ncbi:MAG: hypothetical protein COB37_06705 [Kordiimonadales bacterium]|nr:MAG: hypothetical protein COB37_06705 [Kordiimonadales bacterium]
MDQNTLSIYIHELRNQCYHLQAAFNIFNQSVQAGQDRAILYGAQMILVPASQISSLLWPARARARGRGEALRKALQLNEKHALNDRRLSEVWEHSDEKTEEWISDTKGAQVIFDFVGDPATVGDGTTTTKSVYRGFNPNNRVYTYRGIDYNLPALANAATDVAGRVNALYRQLFPEHAKREDEEQAQIKAMLEQKEQADKNNAERQAAADAAAKTGDAKAAPKKAAAKKTAAPKKAAAKKPAVKKAAAKAPAKKGAKKEASA